MLCYSDATIALQGTTYFIGFTLGSLIWMRLTDFWGRKWMIVGGVLLFLLTLAVYLVKISVQTIYATIFLLGLSVPLIGQISYILQVESVSPNHRACTSLAIHMFDCLTYILLPLVYQFGKNWWILYYISLGLALFTFFPLLFFISESSKFYVSVRKYEEARRVYKYIAKINKKPMFSNKLQGEDSQEQEVEKNNHGLRELFKIKSLRKSLFVVPVAWFAVSFITFGINLSLGKLEGSIYTNGYFSGGSKVASFFVIGPLTNRIGRKVAMISSFFLMGTACLLYEPLKSLGTGPTYASLVLVTLAECFLFMLVYLVTSELFPTVYRGSVFGFSNVMARIGGILAPLVSGVAPGSFMYIFGAVGISTALISFLLKETKDVVMTDTAEQERKKSVLFESEVENQSRENSATFKLSTGVALKADSLLKEEQ